MADSQMAQEKNGMSGGLVFLGTRKCDATDMAQQVGEALDALGERTLSVTISSPTTAALSTAHHDVRLALHRTAGALHRQGDSDVVMKVEITENTTIKDPGVLPADVLLVQIRRMFHKTYAIQGVEIAADPPAITERSAEPKAQQKASDECQKRLPRHPSLRWSRLLHRKNARAASHEEYEKQRAFLQEQINREKAWDRAPQDQYDLRTTLRAADTIDDPTRFEEDRLRLSTWLLSIAVAMLFLPAGAALAVINLLRGENLRLTCQTAALTGTFVGLQTMGAMADAAEVIQAVLP